VKEQAQEPVEDKISDLGADPGPEQLAAVQRSAEDWTPQQVLTWAFQTYGSEVAIASAFGVQGVALIDMAFRAGNTFRVFTLDTQFMFPETYQLMDRIEEKYRIAIERVCSTFSPEEQERSHGPALWERDPDLCCNLRKVEPLRRKLDELRAWITSIRRDQTSHRAVASKIEWDLKFNLVKINPLADWTEKQVWRYIFDHGVPYNELHDQGYPSIGCTHCTRAIQPGELSRAGRWPGFAKTECGLHLIAPAESPAEPEIAKAAEAGKS
jgi:phosphoadenosine phosphosulfate reductase